MQFFDDTLPLGTATVSALPDNTVQAILKNVARPVGTRSLKAVYGGDSLYAGSTATLQVTLK